MEADANEALRAEARRIFRAACDAVEPKAAVLAAVHVSDGALAVPGRTLPLDDFSEVVVVGVGKASIGMAEALQELLGERLSRGVVVTKRGHAAGHALAPRIEVVEASHPTPDASSVDASARVLELVGAAGAKTLVLCCISGGASALLCAPVEGVSLEEKREATRQLLACGCPIGDKNAVLKHLSRVKGGQLLRAARPATLVSLVLSDVVGDPLDTIGSGPTVPDPSTFADCLRVLEDYGVRGTFPRSCLDHLERGARGEVPDTPKAGDADFLEATTTVVAGNSTAVDAAAAEASRLGFNTTVLTTFMEGEAAEVARMWAAVAREELRFGRPAPAPACLIGGGETTVTLPSSHGVGGRSQALALSAAIAMRGLQGVALLAGGTDGGDGPDNDAAGAVVTGRDVAEAERAGLDAREHLQRCDAYTFFRRLEEAKYSRSNVLHLRDGPTGTNVADLVVLLVRPE